MIDGIVERNGKFLVIEGKRSGILIPIGQRIMFEKLQETGDFTILILWGEPGEPKEYQILGFPKRECTLESVKEIVKIWYTWADEQNTVPFCLFIPS